MAGRALVWAAAICAGEAVVLARLLIEEHDPAQLAASVSRVVGVAIQAARAQRAITGESPDKMTDALIQVLTESNVGSNAEEGG